jgi:hypothetical protein
VTAVLSVWIGEFVDWLRNLSGRTLLAVVA